MNLSLDHFGFDPADYPDYSVGGSAFVVPHPLYHLPAASLTINTPNRAVTSSATFAYGATPIFPEASEGRQVTLVTVTQFRPTAAMRIEARWVHLRLARARHR